MTPVAIPDRCAQVPMSPEMTMLMQVIANQEAADEKLERHMREESQEIADKIAEAASALAKAAFISGDMDQHKSDHESRFPGVEEQLRQGDTRMGAIEASIRHNTQVTNEIYEIVAAGKGFFRVVGKIGNAVKWAAGLVASVMALWALFHNHPGGK